MIFRNVKFRSTLAQFLASILVSLKQVILGMVVTMPTIVIGDLRRDHSTLSLTEEQASWFGSLLYLVQPVGGLISGLLQNSFGRKKSLMLVNITFFIGWAALYLSTSKAHLFLAQLILGLSLGFTEAKVFCYIGEISQPRLRGLFSSFPSICYSIGMTTESLLGAAFHWRVMAFFSMIAPLISFSAMTLLPESPAWLVDQGRHEEAGRSYQWLRGWVGPEDVKEELDSMIRYVELTRNTTSTETTRSTEEGDRNDRKAPSFWTTLLEPEVLVALRILFIFFIVSSCVSLTALRPFFIEILDDMKLPYDSYYILTLCSSMLLLAALFLGLGIKLLGKRRLSFLVLTGSILCCFGLAAYLKLGVYVPWLPVLLFSCSYFFTAFGVITISWILIMELLPLRARGSGGAICTTWVYTLTFLVVKTYYLMSSVLGVAGVCFLNGVIGVLGLAYLYWDLPETEGVSLENIEKQIVERRSTRNERISKH